MLFLNEYLWEYNIIKNVWFDFEIVEVMWMEINVVKKKLNLKNKVWSCILLFMKYK